MAVEQGGVCFDKIAAKWHSLAQRRLAHVRELERSGRWKRLYSDEQFRSYLRETERVADLWARLAAGQFAVPPGGVQCFRPLEPRVTAASSSAI
ncbi:MAG: hypothetical protein WAJ88_11485 [Pseudolabrys sp.]